MDTEDELCYIIAHLKEAASVQVVFMKSYRRAIPAALCAPVHSLAQMNDCLLVLHAIQAVARQHLQGFQCTH